MVPATLTHYRILGPLGAGGMGEVFLAEDTKLGRKVALKVLPPALAADPDRRDRFEREARTVAALSHPNIVTLHSIEQHDGVLFLTMELVEGRTLGECIPRQGMPLGELLALAIPLVDAVAAAHQRGVTHRDLKPANVMVTREGRVKVLDFGLAKSQPDSPLEGETTVTAAHLTREGRILGTLAYMSPEQAQGQPVDARSDIFALGILLYEMATGERPFKGEGVSVLTAILRDTPSSVTDVRTDLPRDLSRILKRCLAKDPEDRFQTAKDLRNDLRLLQKEIDSGEAVRGATASTVAKAPLPAPSRGLRWWLVGAVLTVVISATAAGWWWWRGASPGATSAPPFASMAMRRLTNSGEASVAAISPDGRYVVHVVGARDKPSLWLRQVSTSSNVQIVPPAQGSYGALGFSPDGENVLYLFYPPNTFGSVFQIPLLGGPPRRLVENLDTVPAFSPDGRRMAFVRDTGKGVYNVVLANADGSDQHVLATRPALDSYTTVRMAWSPDGTTLATFAGLMPFHRSRIVLLDVATGQERVLTEERFDAPGELAWMPDGRALVFDAVERGGGFGASGQLWSVSYPEGTIRRVTTDVSNYSSLGATRDGRTLVAVQQETRGSLWMARANETTRARAVTADSAGRDGAVGLDWMPDGRIVYGAMTQGSWDLWVSDPEGGAPTQLTSDPGFEGYPCVLPDGRTVAFLARPVGEDRLRLRAIDLDGSHVRDLVPDPVMPGFLQSARGDLFFRHYGGRMSVNPVNRLTLGGGAPVLILAEQPQLLPNFVVRSLSSDARWTLGTTLDPKVPGVTMAVVPTEGGPPIRTFPYESAGTPPLSGGFGWAPGDRAVEALLLRNGVVNLWRFPLDGSPPVQLTTFTSDGILAFAWSRDGKMLALARGSKSADVVVITAQP